MVEEARLEALEGGRTPVTDGWFVVNVRDAAWVHNEVAGAACIFENDDAPFAELGFTVAVLSPGQPSGMYHRESNQEDFLVLSGECLLLLEGEERRLQAWDFVHCPPGTDHIFVGAGGGPCVIFMAGARTSWLAREPPRRRSSTPATSSPSATAPAWRPRPHRRRRRMRCGRNGTPGRPG
jgi:mannose-6-phosphate isomerase-like protein (cupin superfamily)